MLNNSNFKELYTRSGRDVNSEKWSQQLFSDSQDWGTQLFSSQDFQRQSAAPSDKVSSNFQSLSQGGNTCGGPGMSARNAPQPGISKADVYLVRDIRIGLHTILSVMRELPGRLKDITEILRSSQHSQETNCLISETSEKLQGLVLGLEKKLTDLLDNKEVSILLQHETNEKLTNLIKGLETRIVETLEANNFKEILQESMLEHNASLKRVISEVVNDLNSQAKENEQTILEEHRSITKKEVHRELKKFREMHNDLKSHLQSMLDERMISIHEDVTKLYGKVSDHEEAMHSFTMEMKTLTSEKQSTIDNYLQDSFKEVLSSLNGIIDKVTCLPQKIHVEVNQRFTRSQVSPVAHVHPQTFHQNTPSVRKEAQSTLEYQLDTPIHRYQKGLLNSRPITRIVPNECDDSLKKSKKIHPSIMQENPANILHINLLNAETQQFSPESVNVKVISDSEDTIFFHYDSGCSSSSEESVIGIQHSSEKTSIKAEGVVKNWNMIPGNIDNYIEVIKDTGVTNKESKTFRAVTTPNVRKAPFMISKLNASPPDNNIDIRRTFPQPLNPAPTKKSKLDQKPVGFSTVIISPSLRKPIGPSSMNSNQMVTRSRRFLTPASSQGLKFKVLYPRKRT